MTQPPYLQAGDRIAIVSTARFAERAAVEPAFELLKEWGYQVELGDYLFQPHHQFAGSDEQRAQSFQQALDDPGIKAIVCLRGGYGSVRVIDRLDFSKAEPKWIIGYSDVTVLHSHLHQKIGWESLHATMPVNFMTNTPEAIASLKNALTGNLTTHRFSSHPLNRKGYAIGPLVGGNLSIIYSLMGSSSHLETKGKILFLEDLDEYLYHIDRMMWNLKRSGMLKGLAGLIVGGMTDMNDNTIPFGASAEEIIRDSVAEYNFPVAFGFPAGHQADNRTLIMGRKAELSVGENGELSFI